MGVTPVLGSTMLLCTLAAIVFRLNLPAIQLVNVVVYPLQFILLIPFYRLGAWMFRADASTISLGGVAALIREGVWHAIRTLWVVTMHALLAWLGLGMVALAILYAVLVPLVRQLWGRVQPLRESGRQGLTRKVLVASDNLYPLPFKKGDDLGKTSSR